MEKHQNYVWNVFKVNNKGTKTTFSIVNFEQVNTRQVIYCP